MKRLVLLGCLALASCAHHRLAAVPEGATVALPADHGPHPEAQTEWWHVHADLSDLSTGEPVHLFAAFVVERTDLDRAAGIPVSLAVNPFQVAFVQVQTRDRTWTADRANFPDLFAARFAGDGLDLRHGRWRIAWEAGALVLEVGAGRHRMALTLVPTRPATRPGTGGRVELPPGSAHLWAQMEGMAVRGRWRDGRRTRWVEGTGFFKHQWGRIVHPGLDGFEWISMDLPDGTSLCIAWVRAGESRGATGSMAWVSTGEGDTVALPVESVDVTPTRWWRSPRSAARWPVAWRVTGPELDLDVVAARDDQELWVFPTSIYAGPARATGTFAGGTVDVPAFVEQAGARKPPLRALFRSRPPGATP
jgi:predicted secreted hydrolase